MIAIDLFAGGGGASLGIARIGNSVCPPVAAAIVRAQFPATEPEADLDLFGALAAK